MNNVDKKVLVIIPHYNKLALLSECILYIEKQDIECYEVMIVDNGSTDGSDKFIYELGKKNSKYHSLLLNENMGFAYAVNRGLEYAIDNGFEYSILLNNDAYIEKSFIKNLVRKIETSDNIFAVSSLMINYHNQELIDSFGDIYTVCGFACQNKIAENVNTIRNDENCFSACGGASIYSNKILSKIGLFDENFFAYLEDVDLSYRAKLYGYTICTCMDAICYHLGSATSGSKYNEFKVRISARNNIYLLYKNMPFIQLIFNIFPIVIFVIIKQIFFAFKGFGLDYFFGLFDGFRNVSSLNVKEKDFKEISFLTYVIIEIELIVNMIKYLLNFIKRHI